MESPDNETVRVLLVHRITSPENQVGAPGHQRILQIEENMPEPLKFLTDRFDTPIGEMIIVADHDGNLRAVEWTDHEERLQKSLRLHYGRNGFKLEPSHNPSGLSDVMKRYFEGELSAITELPVRTAGTPFQREVWRALREIPHGTTVSYGKLAKQIGRPNAVRAVGLANGSNPIGVVVPCHRLIGSNGSLTGYGGGIERKRWLLEHENKHQPADLPLKLT
jgi:methylated-DNA-[protein]-cysteine S-methyltransferase